MFTEMVVYVDRVFDEVVKPIDCTCLPRREGIARVELTQDKQQRVRIESMSG